MTALILMAALLGATPANQPAAAKRAYTVQDQVALKRLGSFRVSPDGARVVFQARITDLEADRGRTDLWVINIDGTNLRQLTTHPENDSDPIWAPDGKSIYFSSARTPVSQVWRLFLDGGEPVQVTQSPIDVDSFVLSRDGSMLAFAASTYPECDTLDCTKKKLDLKAKSKSSGRLYDSLMVRHWDTWADGRRSHVFAQTVDKGTPVDLMKKMNADAPSKPFGDASEYTFTPDGKSVVFTARDAGRAEAWSTDLDLFVAPIDGSKPPQKLTTTNRATDTAPRFSPDGKSLAYLAMSHPMAESDKQRVMVRTGLDGKDRSLTDAWDRSVDALIWSPDSKALYVTADDVGQRGVFAIDVGSGQVTKLLSQGHVADLQVAPDQLIISLDTLTAPADLYSLSLDGKGTLRPLTALNADALSHLKMGAPEQFSFAGWNGETVYAYVVKPVDFDAKKKYPLAFLIHGGPEGSFGNEWHYRWNPQTYAGHGYVAIMVDFHGSTGYGQGFTDSIRGDWGGKPLEDLQKGLAAGLAKYPFIDKNRMCALGGSYGGYMVNWIAGVWPDPWKCLVSHDGNLDESMAYYDTEELWFSEWEHNGTPWENKASYAKHNPVDHVGQWRVPMLVVHSAKDYRVVDTQGLSTFTVLQRRNVPSKLLYFPDENHWVTKPANSVLWHETVLGWLDQWVQH